MDTGVTHDVAIIGGGAAGLSAAVTLARSLRSVVVVDAGHPRNAPDGHEFPVDALAVAPRFIARADLYEQLGGALAEHPTGAFIATGPMGRTQVPGVWAAGNVSDLGAMVAAATGAGVAAAAAINVDLVAEDAGAAVRARAVPFSPAMEARSDDAGAR